MITAPAPTLGEVKMANQFATHVAALERAARTLGFSPQVTASLSAAADRATIEAKQRACDHTTHRTTEIASRDVRAAVTICLGCRKALLIEDL